MNTREILMSQAGVPLNELPEKLRNQIESNPELLQSFQDQARVASLMKLKNYEQPAPEMEGRVLYQVGIRIRNGEHLRGSSRIDMFPDWARMVAVVMVMLGLSIFTHREMLQNNQTGNPVQAAAAAYEAVIPPDVELETPQLSDPFSPVYVILDSEDTPGLLTPEFSRELETSFAELGLDLTNRVENSSLLPVSYFPAP
ncbi:hypothetical protein P0Y35_01615 [Kiritimatiellaeota bacterium B1221]|nr:hypothetical protein [Kiritimatiellaeota bacterium B1221]